MTTVDLPLLLTSFIAFAAVIGPIVSTCMTIRSNERLKREELHAPKVYSAISNMIDAFHKLHRKNDHITFSGWDQDQRIKHIQDAYTAFSVACFDVMSLMPNESIRCQLTDLLKSIGSSNYQASADHESSFSQIVSDIALELSSRTSKRRHPKNRKRKGRTAKDSSR